MFSRILNSSGTINGSNPTGENSRTGDQSWMFNAGTSPENPKFKKIFNKLNQYINKGKNQVFKELLFQSNLFENETEAKNFFNQYGKSLLIEAIEKNQDDLFNFLVNDSRMKIEIIKDEDVLSNVINSNNSEFRFHFINNINRKKNVNEKKDDQSGRTKLMKKCSSGNLNKAIKCLIDGANIDGKDNEGKTPLMLAIESGNKELVEFLIDAGAKINHKDEKGRSALYLAFVNNNPEIFNIVLNNNKTIINCKNENGINDLMTAVILGEIEYVKFLLENNVPIDAEDNQGNTALMFAFEQGNHKIFNFLLEKGADFSKILDKIIPEDIDKVNYFLDKMKNKFSNKEEFIFYSSYLEKIQDPAKRQIISDKINSKLPVAEDHQEIPVATQVNNGNSVGLPIANVQVVKQTPMAEVLAVS